MNQGSFSNERLRICAVSYLNTVPLIWGVVHGPDRSSFDVTFRVPAQCAEMLQAGTVDVGIVSSIELPRQQLRYVAGVGIISRGPVRSILLISKCPLSDVKRLALDASSRTSVVLARLILSLRYKCTPDVISMAPSLPEMIGAADAAIVIGDPALRLDPNSLPYRVYDLGKEWAEMTGLPMVYAVWAGKAESITSSVEQAFQASYQFGKTHLDDIVRTEAEPRGVSRSLAQRYLTEHIRFDLGPEEVKGLQLYLRYARELNLV